ncbi:C40 family peptidase [Brevibacillus sp. SYSU BS000544]|uniref:C40 family peptidase n=1 Tax=Brevibacillus sp. SYSU BS000544 TaxID=3416443 RepID=UPI003CE5A4EB
MSSWAKKADKIISFGKRYLGTPYLFGAKPWRTSHFDCSSFAQYIYGKHGIRLPRNSRQQSRKGKRITNNQRRKGDLLFFDTFSRQNQKDKIGHVAVYLGNNKMLHASESCGKVCIMTINEYPLGVYKKAKRVIK